ncbi:MULTISPECIES: HlyD family secretion protein [Elizabethkingia]|uniref:Multidrug transporter n=1 Tax=Elizabethkingia anophelis TaxID=1117645 RepID=A0A494JA09_9FLAO|nr:MULTISPECIES: HlyD family secretion protein [Elizabethkingia]AQX52760.1 multidrug transporter [Elizabethkingia anophelis]KUY30663.1 multidrug transporter [Elizabethkingia ursingii]MCT4196713.1 HlyD family secretion protein [Elizabethkingia anophelis]MCT4225343.1 HlyD family secretion protein [Elizabethkingia anophelis]MCT4306934.1 HlyD family secretion protein [Elizabethkingia anophelis]
MKKKYTTTDKLITRITGWVTIVIVALLALWGGASLYDYYQYEQTNDAQVQEYVNPVISRAGGFIVKVKFEENQNVKKGDTLLVIDNREYVLQQNQTQALLYKAQAELKVLETTAHTMLKEALASKEQIASNDAKVKKQELDYNRYKKLYDEESATRQKLEDVEALLKVNKSEYNASRESFLAAQSKIEDVEAEKQVVKAEILRLQALVNRHKLDVGYTVVTAPYNGRMGRRTVEVGQMIDAGETLAFIVNNQTDKWVVANYKETQISEMKIGDKVRIVADAYPKKEFKGTIISLSPATGSSFSLLPPDNSTGNYVKIVQRIPVRIRIDGKKLDNEVLKVGMNVNVYASKKHSNG